MALLVFVQGHHGHLASDPGHLGFRQGRTDRDLFGVQPVMQLGRVELRRPHGALLYPRALEQARDDPDPALDRVEDLALPVTLARVVLRSWAQPTAAARRAAEPTMAPRRTNWRDMAPPR